MLATVPDVIGRSAEEAGAMMKGAGLALSTSERYSNSAPGTVLEQNPAAGSRVQPGTVVAVVIAQALPAKKAPRPNAQSRGVLVPDLVGLNIDAARSAVRQAGLTLQASEQDSSAAPGTVLEQDPAAGTRVMRRSMVTVTIAKAQPPQPLVEVPNVIGRTGEEARRILRDAGLVAGPAKIRRPKGSQSTLSTQQATVISQSRQPGEMVPPGTAVSLSLAQEFLVVPDLVGRDLKSAGAMVRAAGLTLRVTEQKYSTGLPDIVLEQEPPPGTQVNPGSLVGVVTARPQPLVAVPDLTGRTRSEAEAVLHARHLRLGSAATEQSSATPPGTVFRQEPARDVMVPVGSAVEIVLAEAFAVVPNLVGHEVETARSIAQGAGLGLLIAAHLSSDQPQGTVIRQSPPAGSRVMPHSAVNVYVASQRLVKVPDVINSSRTEAETELRRAGVRPGAITSRVTNEVSPGSVLLQQPQAGEMVAPNTAVDLVLGAAATEYRASLQVDNRAPSPGSAVRFTAKLQPQAPGAKYRFEWGDRAASGWLPASSATHAYAKAGTYTASLTVRVQGTELRSNDVQVSVRPLAAVTIGSVRLLVDPPQGRTGDSLKFRAVAQPAILQAEYQFLFGDGQTSGWIAFSEIPHSFSRAGSFQAAVIVRAGGQVKQSPFIPLKIIPVYATWWLPAVIAAVVAAAVTFFVNKYTTRKRLREETYRGIQMAVHKDLGKLQLESDASAAPHPAVRIRAVRTEPELTVSLAEDDRGKVAHA